MIIENNTKTIKQAGNNGQISLGKKYAGKFIPDNEMWLYRDNNNEVLDKAIKWVEKNKRQTSSLRGSYEVTDEAISGNIPEIATLTNVRSQ
ncbi:hypothetical protein RFEPED_1603 [Rickettsia felis str. Pedreira]|uniref:Uncharacterized protein n=2 Tax=Rickettsia felis TaxID=42862 RepID=A0A0F3MUT9_RICFI|nr:hypothetical protein [Rickettsia felis]AAY61712.1 unknown [Rickettsia felis URRWXCal2]KHO03033.1 hypothetical protein JS55_04885 [Rickettsia felis str. LSU]KHO03476.1 hypothetical protein JS61_04755 [Rickettsia felis]KJV59202.1 hypothetical protein RFEPED_1603 [Rickettsia felis str. Pedreira]MDE8611646.1 hypothetical protein [Rickettsia felis]